MLSDLYGIWKESGDGVDAGGRVEACGDCDDAAAAGRDDDCAGNPLVEGVAPITTALRRYMEAYKPVESDGAIEISRIGTIGYAGFIEHCDSIDAVHAQLERDYKVACEVNERQDEEYAELTHRLDRAYEKNRNQRKQLTEVQEALHRRNEGEMKARWQKEIDRLERENEELRRQLESLMFDSRPMTDENMAEDGWIRLPVDANGEYVRIGDVMEWPDGSDEPFEVVGIGTNGTLYYMYDESCEWTNASTKRHHHAPTVEDVLREMHAELDEVTALYVGEAIDSDERDRDEARIFAKYAAKLRLAEGVK